MKTACSCKSESDYQSISFKNFKKNHNLSELKAELEKSFSLDTIYYYILTTVKFEKGKLLQTGSGPNLEGGLITLCTCKHRMRAVQPIERGNWIAGIVSQNKAKINEIEARNSLFYLIRIKKLFENQVKLYEYLKNKFPDSLKTKEAVRNKLGDVFSVKFLNENYHDPNNFKPPIEGHSHRMHKSSKEWNADVKKYKSKPHQLVVGDRKYSYVWDSPKIGLTKKFQDLCRGQRKLNVKDFFKQLEQR